MFIAKMSKYIFQGSQGPAGEDGELGRPGAAVCELNSYKVGRDVRFMLYFNA